MLKWFGHMEMDEERKVRRVMKAKVVGNRSGGRPRFVWMIDGWNEERFGG